MYLFLLPNGYNQAKANLRMPKGRLSMHLLRQQKYVADDCIYLWQETVLIKLVEDVFEGEYHHPYTVGLFDSIPNLTSRATRLKPIPGLMPDPTALPKGCVFAERCTHCMDICKTEHPKVWVNGTHKLCCHLFDDKLKGGAEDGE